MSANSDEKDPWPLDPLRREDLHEGTKTLIHGVSVLLVVFWVAFSFALLFRTALVLLNVDLGVEWLAPTSDRWKDIQYSLIALTAVMGAPFVVWRTLIASEQTRIQQQTHYTDLFTKAVDQLGARTEEGEPNIEVRLGGIYALQRISEESERDYLPIIQTLSAYVRQNLGEPVEIPEDLPPEPNWETTAKDPTTDWATLRKQSEARREAIRGWGVKLRARAARKGAASAHRPDIRAALDVLERRAQKHRQLEVGERGDLPPPPRVAREAVSNKGKAEHNISLAAQIYCERMKVWRERLDGPDLAGSTFQGIYRSKSQLNYFNLSLVEMQGAFLIQSQMQGIDLSFSGLQGAHFDWAMMQGADLRGARLQGADLVGAQLLGTDLSEAWMQGTNLQHTEMQGADLSEVLMQGADLSDANLIGANLRGAQLQFTELSNANIAGALLVSADFTGSNVTLEQLQSAFGDEPTWNKLPFDFVDDDLPDHWSPFELSQDAVEANRQWKAWLASRSS